jgi:hypothetical protein
MKETVNTEKDNANRLEIFENQDYIERKEKRHQILRKIEQIYLRYLYFRRT